MKVNNTHCHFGVEYSRTGYDLKAVFDNSYVGWQNKLPGESKQEIKTFLDKNRPTRAFKQLVESIEKLYGKENAPLDENTWFEYNKKIKKAYEDENHELNVLNNICNYDHIILDDYFKIGNDKFGNVQCDMALRCDFVFYGYSKQALESSEAEPFEFFDNLPDNLGDYISKMRNYITQMLKQENCCTLKICMAYFRGIAFKKTSFEDAQKVYTDPENPEYITDFQDYVMYEICKIAAELNVPVQFHTGLGQLENTSVKYLVPLIKENPNTKFMLLHGSFPWTNDLLAVLYGCQNTYLDICWMPLLSEVIAKNTLISVIELIGADRIVWGCDASTVEESYGALLAAYELLNNTMEYFISNNFFDLEFAEAVKEKILYTNAQRIFNLK